MTRCAVLAVALGACDVAVEPPQAPPHVAPAPPLVAPPPVVEAPPPPPPPPPDGLAVARRVVTSERLTLDYDWQQFIGHPGFMAPVVPVQAGGFLIVGDRPGRRYADERRPDLGYEHGVPVALRVDDDGTTLWEAVLSKPGYATFEAAAGIEVGDGSFVVAVASYPNAAANPVTRFVRLDGGGKPSGEAVTPGTGGAGTPHPISGELREGGAVHLRGWLYREETRGEAKPRFAWEANLSPRVRLVDAIVSDSPLPADNRSHLVFPRDSSSGLPH